MLIDYMAWHEGVPYDLDALDEVTPEQRSEIEALLISRKDNDWRDTEALIRLGSPSSLVAVEESTRGPNHSVRLVAGTYLASIGKLKDLSGLICDALGNGRLGYGLAEAERLASQYPSDQVVQALLSGALHSTDGRAVRFVGILFYIHGKAKEPFDWTHRPFFLRFLTQDKGERRAVFDEMCEIIGIDVASVKYKFE